MPSTTTEIFNADSSSEISTITDPRYLEIDRKQQLIADYLDRHYYDAVIIQNPWNFRWFTSGGSNQTPDGRICASLYLARDTRVLLTSNADAAWLFDTQIPQMGFYVKERSWTEPLDVLPTDLCRGRKVVSDTGIANSKNIDEELQSMRIVLSHREQSIARELGKDLTACVERTALKIKAGQTELDVAGGVTHRLMAAGIQPLGVRVNGDGRNDRYRQAAPRPKRIRKFATLSATGCRNGICLTVSRIICLQAPDGGLENAYQSAAICQATGLYHSQKDWTLEEIWARVQRMYGKCGYADEWRKTEQGEILAQRTCEHRIVPHSPLGLEPGMLIHWKPQIGPASLSDTILVTEQGPEWLTKTDHWPLFQVELRGETISRPALVKS